MDVCRFSTSCSANKKNQICADGSVAAGVAAVASLETSITIDIIRGFGKQLKSAPLMVLDGNLPAEILEVRHCDHCPSLGPKALL